MREVDDRRQRIADLLAKKLDELRARDGTPAVPPAPAATPTPHVAAAGRASGAAADRGPPDDGAALRARFLSEFRGRDLEEALGGRRVPGRRDLVETSFPSAYPVATPPRDEVEGLVNASPWLLEGVRQATTDRLAAEGFADLAALENHARFGAQARRIVRWTRTGNVAALAAHLGARAARSHRLAFLLAGFFGPGDLLFLDLETMGLFAGSPIAVAGLARWDGEATVVRQLVATSPDGEASLVDGVVEAVDRCSALVTFNGRSFDWPYLCQRAAFHGRVIREDPLQLDLLPFSRRTWGGATSDCRLDTLAREVLGVERGEDLPGSLVPAFYQEYLRDPDANVGLLAGIVRHNRHDMEQMVALYGRLLPRMRDEGA